MGNSSRSNHWHILSWQQLNKSLQSLERKMFQLNMTQFLDLKKYVFEKIMLQNEIFTYFHCCLDLKVRKDIQVSSIVENQPEQLKIRKNEIFNCFLWIFCTAWKCDCDRIKIPLWATFNIKFINLLLDIIWIFVYQRVSHKS